MLKTISAACDVPSFSSIHSLFKFTVHLQINCHLWTHIILSDFNFEILKNNRCMRSYLGLLFKYTFPEFTTAKIEDVDILSVGYEHEPFIRAILKGLSLDRRYLKSWLGVLNWKNQGGLKWLAPLLRSKITM